MNEYTKKKNRKTTFRLVKYFSINPKITMLSLFLALLVNAAVLVQPLIIMTIIDNYILQGIFYLHIFIWYGIIYFAVALLANGTNYAQAISLRYLSQQILHKIRTDLFSHIQTMNMRFFDNHSSGRIFTRVTSDVETLSELYNNFFVMIIRESVMIFMTLTVMFALDPMLALWCLASIPVVTIFTIIHRIIARRNFIKIKAILSRINGFLAEHIIGMRIIQIFNMEEKKLDDFKELNDQYYNLGLIEVILNGLSAPVVTLISNFVAALLIYVFADNVLDGTLMLGVLFTFTTYVRQLFQPISQLAEQLTTAQSALISADRIFDIIDNTEDFENFNTGNIIKNFKGGIEFKNVWFAYSGDNWVLKDVSFKIIPGTRAAFVGATGCGKTTIMSLISRFYEIQKGQILIDGQDVKDINIHSLRRIIAIVMQDVFLFAGDIRYNIRLNNLEIKDSEIIDAAKTANCHDMIMSLSGGYMHNVAERGSDFSMGQRQLISFARAVATQPKLLILDEATASIDSDTEKALQEGLENFALGKTLMVIAHRLSTISDFEIIFVMDKGKIVEEGNHESLMDIESGIYRKLFLY